jgi:hypothetical protein
VILPVKNQMAQIQGILRIAREPRLPEKAQTSKAAVSQIQTEVAY